MDQKGQKDRNVTQEGTDDCITFEGNQTLDIDQNWLFYKSAENCSIQVNVYEYYAD